MSSVSVWDRLNHTQAEASVARPQSEAKSEEERREWRRSFWRTTRVLDLLALLFWGYLVTKVFVADLDLAAVQALAPQYEWVVQVRVVWFLAILLVLAVVGRKKFPIWTGYILVWPLALLVWRLPWALWRRRAWKVAVWLIQMVLVPSSKPLITIGLSLVTVACTLLVLMGGKTLAAIGGTLSVATWLATLFLSARGVTKPSRFVMMQRWFLRKMSPKETDGEPKGRQVELMKVAQSRELTTAESEEFLRLAATDLGLINFLPFWATKFAEYTRSAFYFVAGPLWTLTLLLGTAYYFGLANFALFKADHSQFFTQGQRSSLVYFFYYSITGLYGGEVDMITPSGALATLLKTTLAIAGPLILLILVAALYQTFRQARDQADVARVVADFRRVANERATAFPSYYAVSPAEALQRMKGIGYGLVVWVERLDAFMALAETQGVDGTGDSGAVD